MGLIESMANFFSAAQETIELYLIYSNLYSIPDDVLTQEMTEIHAYYDALTSAIVNEYENNEERQAPLGKRVF